MALPPLAPVPNLRRLLTPEEKLLYTVKFHPLRGWRFLAGALVCLGFSYLFPPALLGCVVLAALWYIPHVSNEVAVTDKRLLMRIGLFQLLVETMEDQDIRSWKLEQNPLDVFLHTGRVRINVLDNAHRREIVMNWIWHPMTFLEALEALQDDVRPTE